ncbi:MAG: response regulator transcription factor [Pseudomonadales bacterium]|nr:response regulator transcription factor [Pseudomonadales bacterium]
MAESKLSSQSGTIRVLLIDRRPIVLKGLEVLIHTGKTSMLVVGTADSSTRALSTLESASPDIILFGAGNPVGPLAEETRQLASDCHARLLVLTDGQDDAMAAIAAQAGARGVIELSNSPEKILQAIERVHAGELWFNRSTLGRIFGEHTGRKNPEASDPVQQKLARLTKREREIVAITSKAVEEKLVSIARGMNVSEHTLRNHMTSIYEKLDITNRLELYAFVQKIGLKAFLA